MKKLILILTITLLFSAFLNSCIDSLEEKYSDMEIGQTFGSNIDGYQKKLPHNFCLDVNLGTKTRLIKIPDDKLDLPYFANSVYNSPTIAEGHFIKGWYNDNRVILCEETTEGITYVVIEFETQKTERIANEEELAKYGSISWFALCNTYEQIID